MLGLLFLIQLYYPGKYWLSLSIGLGLCISIYSVFKDLDWDRGLKKKKKKPDQGRICPLYLHRRLSHLWETPHIKWWEMSMWKY